MRTRERERFIRDASSEYADLLRRDFHTFVARAFLELHPQTRFERGWHLEVLAAKLEAVERREIKRLIVNIPPRHLKSVVASVAFPAWLLGRDPRTKVLCVSYGQDLADKLARDCRSLMTSAFYGATFDTRLSAERQAVAEFETNEGGARLSTSVGGVVTGRGADIIVIDDPMKAEDALSESRRRTLNEWYDNTLRSRLNSQETGAIVLVMQRLHADDLVAHVQEQEKWELVTFPAVAEEDEIISFPTNFGERRIARRKGEVLVPALQSAATLENLRRQMTDYNFAAQYQQAPQPPAGLVVRRNWLRFYGAREQPETFDQVVQSWDTASKTSELSDYSACVTLGSCNQVYYILDVFRRRMEFPELKRMVREQAALWHADVVLVEDKSSGTQLIQEMRRQNFSIIEAAPKQDGDKLMRLRAQTAKIEGGFVRFPEHAPWLDDYLAELTSFPNSRYDDQVDATVHALAWITNEPPGGANAWIRYMRELGAGPMPRVQKPKMLRVYVPLDGYLRLITGRMIAIPPDKIVTVTEEEADAFRRLPGAKVVG